MRQSFVAFDSIAVNTHCRLDQKYLSFVSTDNWTVFKNNNLVQVPLSHYLTVASIKKLKKGTLDQEYTLINISDQLQKTGDITNTKQVREIGSDKNILSGYDFFISKLGMPRGYIFSNSLNDRNDVIGSTELIPYRLTFPQSKIFLKYLLLHPQMLEVYRRLESGKTPSHRRVNPSEFLKIKVPLLSDFDLVTEKIAPLSAEILKLEEKIESQEAILNRIFAKTYDYDEELHNELGKGMTAGTQASRVRALKIMYTNLCDFANTKSLRNSTRSNNPVTRKLTLELKRKETIKIGDITLEPIRRGKSPKYDPSGPIPVVKTGHLKNGSVVISNEEFVTEEFYSSSNKAHIKRGDILIASTGKVSLGKVSFYEGDERLIADSHVSIVRLRADDFNGKFIAYFLRSLLGYFQIERDFTGSTNQIELSPDAIREILVPNEDISSQNRIVELIDTHLHRQNAIVQEIKERRQSIDKIISLFL